MISNSTDSPKIVEAIIWLARSLNMRVTAEGVQTEQQLAMLRAMGCDEVQGYLVSQPIPAAKVLALISKPRVPVKRAS